MSRHRKRRPHDSKPPRPSAGSAAKQVPLPTIDPQPDSTPAEENHAGDGIPPRAAGGTAVSAVLVRNYGPWRAATLTLVYILFIAHIIHWKLAGKTLAPLELNEVMHTLEMGIVTAGFLFMCVACLATLIFGRFFCSWGCHILALQDLCRWLLDRLGIRPRLVRSRVLLLVPIITALYMFVWPQVTRIAAGEPLPIAHLRTDAEGWGSFVTEDLWRNLPGPWVTAITFLICGFGVVYVLGARGFCTYACPYGAIFGFTDRFATGRIRASDACIQCATCTATCTSGIRVHEEVNKHGMVVNPACMKDLDCVAACPTGALHYGYGKPALFRSYTSGGRFGLPYDFSLAEDVLMAIVFVAMLLIFRGLYGAVPFLMTLGLGGIVAYLTVVAVRLPQRSHLRLASWTLRKRGRTTASGTAFAAGFALLFALIAHSAFIRYNEFRGQRYAATLTEAHDSRDPTAAAAARAHLETADRWGLFRNERTERGLLHAAWRLERFDDVAVYVRRLLIRDPDDLCARLHLAQSLAAQSRWADAERWFRAVLKITGSDPAIRVAAHQGLSTALAARRDFTGAVSELRAALEIAPDRAGIHAALGGLLAETGQFDQAVASLREAVWLNPSFAEAHYNLGTLFGHLGRLEQAIASYENALEIVPDDSDTLNNLGFALLRLGRVDAARERLQQAIEVAPDNANAHFNLARLFASQQELDRADEHRNIAARLDPRYAEPLQIEDP